MAVNKFISSQYPSFVTDAFNQYQPQFLQKLLSGQPLMPTTAGEQSVIQQGRDFTANPLSNPLFSAYSQAQTNLMAPSEDVARRNLADTYRRAGAGTLQSGAFAEGASNLERDLATNRGDLITKGYAQLYPAIGNQLTSQAGLEALPRLQQEKTLSFLQSLLGAKNQSTGVYNENSTGENVAQFLSPLLAAVLGSAPGSTGSSIGSGILGLLKSGALKIGDLLGLTGNDTGNLDQLLQDLPFSNPADVGSLIDSLGNYANFDFSTLGSGGDWSFANDFGNTGNWGFDLSNFSDALAGQGATAGADFGSALDNFQPFDLPYGNPADVGALAGSLSGSAPLGDFAGSFGGLGGAAVGAGVGAILNALGVPPIGQTTAGILTGALLGANPITYPLAFLGPLLSGAMNPHEEAKSIENSIKIIQTARTNIQNDLAAGNPVNAKDLRDAMLIESGNQYGYEDPILALSRDLLQAQATGGQVNMSGENYLFSNIPLWARSDKVYGLNEIPQFNLPQVYLTPQDFQTGYGDIYNEGRTNGDAAWFPGMYDALIGQFQNPTITGGETDYSLNDTNVNDRRE